MNNAVVGIRWLLSTGSLPQTGCGDPVLEDALMIEIGHCAQILYV